MLGLRNAGVLGASAVLAGGVAYFVWSYGSSRKRNKLDSRPGEDGREKVKVEVEREKKAPVEETVVPAKAATTAAVKAHPVESEGTQVLVLGLDGAGKTSLLHCFSSGSLEQDVEPTQGLNAISISKDDMDVEFLEIGGGENLRPYWQKYTPRALLLVFVVDSANPELFPVTKKHLHELLALHPNLPLMVLANKQDLPTSCSITDLHDALSLSEAGDRQLFLIGTYVRKGDSELSSGVHDARDLIFQMVSQDR
ncbi:ADP-ribosylation factor-like protein 9 isoform X1 [Poecilia formosa]|uniref:ADP-ribosylation factor-like 9 n=1 Tax=Poecilia formosa TaxID=48698 RepID=A0A087XCQ8_POEFO|nr:PREDICTED: ADP-ribosylation factor-like protein 9 isoform X1 [Poecilia formosa]